MHCCIPSPSWTESSSLKHLRAALQDEQVLLAVEAALRAVLQVLLAVEAALRAALQDEQVLLAVEAALTAALPYQIDCLFLRSSWVKIFKNQKK